MNDKPNTEGEQPKPDDKADKKTTIVPILSAVSCTNPNAEHAENTAQGSDSDKKKPGGFIGNPDWWMVGLTGLLFVAGVITIVIFHRQLVVMQNTLTEIQNSGKDTHALAEAAGDQAEADKNISIQSKNQADDTHDLASQTKTLADQMKAQAIQTKAMAEATSKQLTDFEDSQQAILQIVMVWDRKNETISSTVNNIGKTPAVDIAWETSSGGGNSAACIGLVAFSETHSKDFHSYPGGLTLAAGEPLVLDKAIMGVNTTQLNADYDSGHRCGLYTAAVSYRDIFGKESTSSACLYYSMALFHSCQIIPDAKPANKTEGHAQPK